jgi:hypothetical protein
VARTHRIENDAPDKVHQHLGQILQLAWNEAARGTGHHHERRDEGHNHPHHDHGLIDGNIQPAEIDRNIVVQFKRMERIFFHRPMTLSLPTRTIRRILPPLREAVGVSHTGRRAEPQSDDESPGSRPENIRVDHPSNPAPDDQRSQQFRSDPNGLAEPRIKRIL